MAVEAHRLLRIRGLDGAAVATLFLAAACAGVVFREPSPYDVMMGALMVGFAVAGLHVPRAAAPLALLLAAYVVGAFAGAARTSDVETSLVHSWVTFYLAATALFFACVAAWQPARALGAIFAGTLAGALVAALAGIAGYFDLVPGSGELFTLYGRARGTFKDPNVFAPFLVLPLLYAAYRLVSARFLPSLAWAAAAAVLLAGLFLSFSRGGWLNFAISAAMFTLLMTTALPDRRLSLRTTLLAMLGTAVIACTLAWAVGASEIGELFARRAQLAQPYDTSVAGRFAGQLKAMAVIVAEPLGIGYGAFERHHPEQPHNVYLNAFLNAGWLGGFAYLTLVLVTFMRALTLALRHTPMQPLAIILCASFVGLMVEGLFVDTDHWRHFMMVLGLIWGMAALAPEPRALRRTAADAGAV